jgi:hypothetical protein
MALKWRGGQGDPHHRQETMAKWWEVASDELKEQRPLVLNEEVVWGAKEISWVQNQLRGKAPG